MRPDKQRNYAATYGGESYTGRDKKQRIETQRSRSEVKAGLGRS